MGLDAGTPPGLWERVRKVATEEVVKFARSGFLRNASISDGGLTIKGGFLRLLTKVTGGVELFYLGPVTPNAADGTPQQGWIVRRADGSSVLILRDQYPTDSGGALNQALNWFDRGGNVVLADDTNSGQGLARPYLPVPFYRARNGDWPVTTSATFETLFRAKTAKQHPRLFMKVWSFATAAGTTGDIQVLVNGLPWGSVAAVSSTAVSETVFGPLPVDGAHMSLLTVEVQARRTAGSGGIQVGLSQAQGEQS